MPDITVDQIVQDVKGGKADPDKYAVFDRIHHDIANLQRQDGGEGNAKFQDDLHLLNDKLHEQNILPSFQITGIQDASPPPPGSPITFGSPARIKLSDGTPRHSLEFEPILSVRKWYPDLIGQASPTQQRLLEESNKALGKQLWEARHPSPGLADSPDPPGPPYYGGAGGYGCAPSVSEALRRANIFSPDEDPLNVQDVQTILQNSHGWKPVFDSRTDPGKTPCLETQVLEPGDVICGYRQGKSYSGAGAHVGIIGKDGKVYAHEPAPDPDHPGHEREQWTQSDLTTWHKNNYTAGIVVLRAPDAA